MHTRRLGQADRLTPLSENILNYSTIRSRSLAKIARAQARWHRPRASERVSCSHPPTILR
eukprot:5011469-Pleurochrysis_carterae.AAC.1